MSFFWEGNRTGFITPLIPLGKREGVEVVKRAHLTSYLIGADQKIPNRLIKTTFLGKVETAIKLDVKSVFDILGIRQLMQFWASGFLFNRSIYSFLSFSAISPWQ